MTTVRRAFREFLAVPTLVVLGFLLLAVISNVLDAQAPRYLSDLVAFMKVHVFGSPTSTASLLTSIATSVITVASITFSVLFLAVQQSAASMSAQVYDQYMRRRANQLFFGFFLGLGLYSLVILSTVTPTFNPVLGGTVALILTGVALVLIPAVIYTTLDQMRPVQIVSSIKDHALAARARQADLLGRTRRVPVRHGPGSAIRSRRTGYLTGLQIDAIATALEELPGEPECELAVRIGDFIVVEDSIGVLRGADGDVDDVLARIEGALTLDRQRDLDSDPAFACSQLESIAWTSTTSAKENPATAVLAIHQLRDLITRLAISGEETRGGDIPRDGRQGDHPVALVYDDDLLPVAIGTLASIIVGASEGMQHQTVAAAYLTYAALIAHLGGTVRIAAVEMIRRSLTGLADQILTLELEGSLRTLADALDRDDLTTAAADVRQATDRMSAASGRLSARGTRPAGLP